jgi:RNA polymerase sigma-70 factor (ECF subfamily)
VTEAERDEELVRRFRAGEAEAFTRLVERHQQRVYRLCLRVLSDPEAAADVAQDTFITVLRKLDGFRGDAAFTTWLHRVAVNACYDELRRRRRRPALHVVNDEGRDHEPGPPIDDRNSVVNLGAGINGRYLFPSIGVFNCPLTRENVFWI